MGKIDSEILRKCLISVANDVYIKSTTANMYNSSEEQIRQEALVIVSDAFSQLEENLRDYE